MLGMTVRNWKLFYRDRGVVFFSLLGPIMIVALYILFLKGTVVPELPVEGAAGEELLNNWIMAGIIASATVTTCLSGYGTMIRDQQSGISKDFATAPISRSSIIWSYLLNSVVIGTIMSLLTVVVAELYVVAYGGHLLSVVQVLKVLGIVVVSVVSAAGLLAVLASLIRTEGAFSGANVAIGAAIGFVVGAYIPIGSLPGNVQQVLKALPSTHSAMLLRQVMLEGPEATAFAGAPTSVVNDFDQTMGVVFIINGSQVTPLQSLAYLAVSGIVGFAVAVLVMRLRRKSA